MDESSEALSVRGFSLADVQQFANDMRKLRGKINEVERLRLPAPRFQQPSTNKKPMATWAKEERDVFEWVIYFENQEQTLLKEAKTDIF